MQAEVETEDFVRKEAKSVCIFFFCVLTHLLACCYDNLHLVLKFQIPTPWNLQSRRKDKVCYPATAGLSSDQW